MAVRDDIHVEWYRSPRIVVVEAPSKALDLQDLVDTMAEIESELGSLDDFRIVESSGKQAIGAAFVGITVVLHNAQVAFEERVTPAVIGTATSDTEHDGLPGQILKDTGNDLSGVKPGDTVMNMTDASLATVIEGIDADHIRHYALSGGSSNEWAIGDSYRVYAAVECAVSGGNLTAIDDLGDPISAQVAASFVSYVTELSTSASLQVTGSGVTEQDKLDIADRVWDASLEEHTEVGSSAEALQFLADIQAGRWRISGSQMVFYQADNVTEICRFDLKDVNGEPIPASKILVHDRLRV